MKKLGISKNLNTYKILYNKKKLIYKIKYTLNLATIQRNF